MKYRVLLCSVFLVGALGWTQTEKPVDEVMVIPISAPAIINVDLRHLPRPQAWQPGDPIKEVPKQRWSSSAPQREPEPKVDPLGIKQSYFSMRGTQRAFSDLQVNIDGQGFSGVNPPDTVGDVGRDYYIQSINGGGGALYTIYNKSDGSVAAGPFTMAALGSGNCSSGLGDPIILYDNLAERWMITEFTSGSNDMCVYISQTADPISGGWFAYSFTAPSFPDYPKYGIYDGSYLISSNESGPSPVYAIDRTALLAGNSSTLVRATVPSLGGFGFQALTPVDLDGPNPAPVGTPLLFLRHNDDEVHGSSTATDFIEIYEFSVDWGDPGSAALNGPTNIAVTDFDSSLCGLTSFSCMDQPNGGTPLDPLREVIMNRLVYRNFETHEVILGNFVTDVDGTDRGGIRWFELRRTSPQGAWNLFQEGTVTFDDDLDRWMAGIAMDGSGNIALAYNVSNASNVFPGIRYVGRLASDPLGVMTQGEFTIVDGSGVNSSQRYGDYSAMGIDPVEDCVFWFTGEYNPASAWSTRIASFGFDACGCEQPGTPTNVMASTGQTNNSVVLSWGAVPDAASYNIYRAQADCQSNPNFELLEEGVTGTTFNDTTPSGSVPYSYQVAALASDGCRGPRSQCASVTPTGDCSLTPTFLGATSAESANEPTCKVIVTWGNATSNCGGQTFAYSVYRSEISSFVPSPSNIVASCLAGNTYEDTDVNPGTTYYYIVRAEDAAAVGSGACSGGIADTNTFEVSATPLGQEAILFSEDLEQGDGNFTVASLPGDTTGNNFALTTDQAASPVTSFFVSDEDTTKDQVLNYAEGFTPTLGAVLSFNHFFNTEATFDGGVLEYSVNGTDYVDILDGTGAIPSNPGRMTQNGYNNSFGGSGPLAGRQGWSGNSSDFVQTQVSLDDFAGQQIFIRWRFACDGSVAGLGWYIDDITVSTQLDCEAGGTSCDDFNQLASTWSTDVDVRQMVECVNLQSSQGKRAHRTSVSPE